ncbi:hypothetical protein OC834_007213, partial [Tilletia horrida]
MDTTFRIGKHASVPAFVQLDELRAHLAILNVFRQIREDVLEGKELPADILSDPSSVGPPPKGKQPSVYYPIAPPPTKASNKDPDFVQQAVAALSDEMTTTRRWKCYLQRAVARFEVYINEVLPRSNTDPSAAKLDEVEFRAGGPSAPILVLDLQPQHLPPIDVLMVWHSFLLNPARFWEEAYHGGIVLKLLSFKFPLLQMASAIDPVTNRPHTPAAEEFWNANVQRWRFHLNMQPPPVVIERKRTGRLSSPNGMHFPCPHCGNDIFVPWMSCGPKETQRGLVEDSWLRSCARPCFQSITADKLRGKRLVQDLELWERDPDHRMAGTLIDSRNGTLLDDVNIANSVLYLKCSDRPGLVSAQRSKSSGPFSCFKPQSTQQLVMQHRFRFSGIAQSIQFSALDISPPSKREKIRRQIQLLLSPYGENTGLHETMTDLVGAVQRQFKFVEEMTKLGWANTENLAKGRDDISLALAIVRYHSWMHLMSRNKTMLCPTLDI